MKKENEKRQKILGFLKGNITRKLVEIKKKIKWYYEKYYAKVSEKLHKMNRVLEIHKLLKLSQEETELS